MKDFLDSIDLILKETHSDKESGLSSLQVNENRDKYGLNTLTKKEADSLWKRIWDASTEPMLLMLIAAGIIALGVNIFRYVTGEGADFLECVGIFIAIALSVAISVVMEGRSAKAFEALSKISKNTLVKVIRDHKTQVINKEDLVVGDVVLLQTGDKITADCRLLESVGLSVDESTLTGESVPAHKEASSTFTDEKTPLAERSNMLYSGTFITSGNCKAIVTAVGDHTEFGVIAKNLHDTDKVVTPLQEKLSRLGKKITILGVSASALVFVAELISFFIHGQFYLEAILEAFVNSIVLIVAAVPEGLPTIVAVSLSINIIKLSKNNALVKKMIASETVGCINVVCSDKTGTLTENKMKVRYYYDSTFHENCNDFQDSHLIHNICLNTTADLGDNDKFIGNPTECAMLYLYEHSNCRVNLNKSYKDLRESRVIVESFPFSSDLKHMTTIVKQDNSWVAYVKGSPERILEMCNIEDSKLYEIKNSIEKVQKEAMRVIAFSHKDLNELKDFNDPKEHDTMEQGMVFDGFVAISDPLRKEVYSALQSCKEAGVELKILTGDNIVTATAIANELKLLDNGKVALEAKDIEKMSDETLSKNLNKIAVIARSTPSIKMRVVKLLKALGNVVAVTGDGINDAPALKNADVGIAMGISGTEVSKEASDIVLLDDSFATIIKAVEWGRNIYENFKRFISFQLTVNVSSVVVVFVSILLGLKAPFTALQLLWINIIMDGPPALTLGLEPNNTDLMKRQPTKRDENIITRSMFFCILLSGSYISIVFLCQYLFNFLNVESYQESTVLFTLFVLFQLFNSFNCRELHLKSIFTNLFKNKLMLIVVGLTFVLQIVFIQYAGAFFGTVALPFEVWVKIFALSFTIIIWFEVIKFILRLKKSRSN